MEPNAALSAKDQFSTRYSLLSRLQDWEDAESWKDFFETYSRLICSVAAKAGLTEAEAKDVLQETTLSVAKSTLTRAAFGLTKR